MNNKRGLSAIAIALIIIFISLAIIGGIWFVVNDIIFESSRQIEPEFLINLDITNAFEQGESIVIDVTRKLGAGELVKIKFILFDGENSEVVERESSLNEQESDRFFIIPSELTATEIETVSVTPIFMENESEFSGDVTDTYNVGASGEGGIDGDCVPECKDYECGNDYECGQSCGTCEITENCINHVCVSLNCTPNSQRETCGAWLCGTRINNCGAEVICGTCLPGQLCPNGICTTITPINSGKVQETWPGESGIYFGSVNLPVDISYENYYIEFPDSEETDCLLIASYTFPTAGYLKSYIGFNFETLIKTGDNYQIWETIEECLA